MSEIISDDGRFIIIIDDNGNVTTIDTWWVCVINEE